MPHVGFLGGDRQKTISTHRLASPLPVPEQSIQACADRLFSGQPQQFLGKSRERKVLLSQHLQCLQLEAAVVGGSSGSAF